MTKARWFNRAIKKSGSSISRSGRTHLKHLLSVEGTADKGAGGDRLKPHLFPDLLVFFKRFRRDVLDHGQEVSCGNKRNVYFFNAPGSVSECLINVLRFEVRIEL
jgi:hypothetical protein